MKKKQKKSKKKRKVLKKTKSYKFQRKSKKTKRVVKRFKKKRVIKKRKNKVKKLKKTNYLKQIKKTQNESIVLKLVKLQLSLKPQFNLKFNFSLEKHIQGFFDKISETISSYKVLKRDEKRRIKIEKIERERLSLIHISEPTRR